MPGPEDHPHGHKHKPHDDGRLKPHEVVDQKVETIQERNARVEAEKAWEVSWTRRLVIAAITYGLIGFHSSVIGVPYPWLNALIPAGGYLLSTLTMPFLKTFWQNHFYKSQEEKKTSPHKIRTGFVF